MKRPELLIVKGLLAGTRVSVGAEGVRIGRSSSNDVCIRDEELSRNHCLVEPAGDSGLVVTDLASANGTFVNGEPVGDRARELVVGDTLSIGGSQIRVVAADAPASASPEVDLGLGTRAVRTPAAAQSVAPPPAPKGPPDRRRALLWGVTAGLLVLAAAVFVFGDEITRLMRSALSPSVSNPSSAAAVVSLTAPVGPDDVREMFYEKVSGDSESVFRYAMTLDEKGYLRVIIDDTSDGGRRHVVKNQLLKAPALRRLREILADPAFAGLDRDYVGPDGEPPALQSCRLKVIYASRVRAVSVVNAPEPEEFRRLREKLEAFTKNELGVWAIQYSRERLVALATASAEAGRVKWEDREVEHGNVHAAIRAYREAVFYLDTVNPRPPEYESYRAALAEAEKELERRYREQRFCADRAINLADWEKAREELQILCEIVPDREDERYREASAKLVDVETRLNRKGGAR